MFNLERVETPRLILRRMVPEDEPLLRRMDSDPVVMKTLGGVRDPEDTAAYLARQVDHWSTHGFGWWIAEDRATSDFVGRGGIRHIEVEGEDVVEVGYGLMSPFWGRGIATELASAAVSAGLREVGLPLLVGITTSSNEASQNVLQKVGFRFVRNVSYKDHPHLLYHCEAMRDGAP